MPQISKHSWPRLLHIISMLKENRYPNYCRILSEMRIIDEAGAYRVSQKTIQRDIRYLREDLHAPIAYDHQRRGYYLTNQYWSMDLPILMTKDLEAAALSARLAEKILPAPVAGEMRKSLDSIFAASDVAVMDDRSSLLSLVATGSQVPLDPEIFGLVFKAWRARHQIRLAYTSAQDGDTFHMVAEPHVLAFHHGIWYLIVRILERDDHEPLDDHANTLAVHRIRQAEWLPSMFETDPDIQKQSNEGNLFDFPEIHDVVLQLKGRSIIYGRERYPQATILPHEDGTVTLRLPTVETYDVMNFILSWGGEVTVKAPASLVHDVVRSAEAILRSHGARPQCPQEETAEAQRRT